jgi:hypothetical protein
MNHIEQILLPLKLGVFEAFKMKIRLFFFILTVLAVIAAGCSSAPASSSTTPSVAPTSAPSSQTTTAAPATQAAEWSPDGVIQPGEYTGSRQYGAYSIHWRSDGQFIYLGLSARTSGWVAVAFQPGTGMKGADMLLGLLKDGKAEIQDRYCTDNLGTHPADIELGGIENILDSGGKEENGLTTLEFKRALNTGDKYDVAVKTGANQILWSYGTSDNPDLKHANKGYGEINLP